MGSLIEGGKDVSGQMYKRNRYYDPSTGKFTQEDPIGLAGGLNAYGFAGGDPVNFSDPYGLCPEWLTHKPCRAVDAAAATTGAIIGGVLGGGGGAIGGLGCGLAAPVCSPAFSVAGAGAGALQGAAIGLSLSNTVRALTDGIENAFANSREGTGSESVEPQYKVRKPGQSGKEAANDAPSWARGERPYVNENGNQFARRLLNEKYGEGNWGTGPRSEYNMLRKYADRGFVSPSQ